MHRFPTKCRKAGINWNYLICRTCKICENLQAFNGDEIIDINVWSPHSVQKVQSQSFVWLYWMRSSFLHKSWLLPSHPKVHDERNGEVDIVDINDFQNFKIHTDINGGSWYATETIKVAVRQSITFISSKRNRNCFL